MNSIFVQKPQVPFCCKNGLVANTPISLDSASPLHLIFTSLDVPQPAACQDLRQPKAA